MTSQKEESIKIVGVRHIVSLGAGTMGQQIALRV